MLVDFSMDMLRKMRIEKKISQEVAAASIGISRRHFQRMEAGTKTVSMPQATQLAKLYGVEVKIKFIPSKFITLDY